jgi:GTP-binding protein Era
MSDTNKIPSVPPGFRAGFVAIIGRPNVGKSTLLNQILGEKLAIVSPRPQTTRRRLLGVKHRPDAQIALVDTPGLHRPGQRGTTMLNRYMVEEARAAWSEVDVVLFVTEVGKLAAKREPDEPPPSPHELIDPGDRFIVEQLARAKQKVVLAMNKVDLVRDKRLLLPLLNEWSTLREFAAIVPVSAQKGIGVDKLEGELASALPESPALFPEDMLTDSPERALVAERVREQIFRATYREVPYATAVTVDSWEEQHAPGRGGRRGRKKLVSIGATVHVEKPNQKKILIGEGGATLRTIGTAARLEIETMLGTKVFLELFVRVDPEWSHSQLGLREMGYDPHHSDGRGA